jgi:dipeptide/tripeptide permease
VYQAEQMDRNIFGFTINPGTMTILNPLFIVVLVPLFDSFLYPMIQKVVSITINGTLMTHTSSILDLLEELELDSL